ncbi:hypothetical protein CTI12_AA333760 [Artemisia annua]|uniref:DUF4057 domain-containing protein n=1 Tax=Artemisia annua TaxID=35608 RepID=A0A2U1MXL3_ARTAN|nr:hypothetical protein CTI12_AA333760 [Artemisia annua]
MFPSGGFHRFLEYTLSWWDGRGTGRQLQKSKRKPVSGYRLKDIGRGGIFVSGGENGVEEAAAATCTLSNPTGIWMYQLLTFLEWLNAKEFELKDHYNYVRGSDQ